MDTDKQLYKLFAIAPAQLYALLNIPVPGPLRARSVAFKELETSSDLVIEPDDPLEPVRLIEFQGYRDKQFIPKVMLRCALFRMQFPSRPFRCHVIYLDRSFESVAVDDGGLFQPQVQDLQELWQQLAARFPDSPLLSVLHPLLAENEKELTATLEGDYERIQHSTQLTDQQRGAWLDVFHFWLMTRLQLSLEEIQEMVISKLPEVEELPWGKELKERWTSEGREEARADDLRNAIERVEQLLQCYEEMRRNAVLSDVAYGELKARAEKELHEHRENLKSLNGPSSD